MHTRIILPNLSTFPSTSQTLLSDPELKSNNVVPNCPVEEDIVVAQAMIVTHSRDSQMTGRLWQSSQSNLPKPLKTQTKYL
jgi:hypothetical protein